MLEKLKSFHFRAYEKTSSAYFQLLTAGIFAILIVIPLFPKLPLIFVPKTFVAIRPEDFVILLFTLLALPVIWQKRRQLLSDNLVLAILSFWLIGLFSTYGAIFVTKSVTPHLAILHYLRRIEYLVPFFIVLAVQPDIGRIKEFIRVLFAVSALVVIYGVGQIYFGFPVFSTANTEFAKGIPLTLGPEARVNATFAGHYDLAAFSAIMLVILGAFLFGASFGERQKVIKVALFLLAISNLWLLLQTASRISFVAYLAGIATVLLLLKKRLILILVIAISFLSLLSSSELRTRFFNTFKYGIKTLSYQVQPVEAIVATQGALSATQSATTSATPKVYADIAPGEPTDTQKLGVFRSSRVRFDFEWPAAIRAFLRNPVLGSGYSSLGLATDNDYLRSLGEVGIFGTAALILIFAEIAKRIRRFLRNAQNLTFEKTIVVGSTGMIAALLVNATFIDVFEASKIAILFWTLIGILVVTIKLSHEENSENY